MTRNVTIFCCLGGLLLIAGGACNKGSDSNAPAKTPAASASPSGATAPATTTAEAATKQAPTDAKADEARKKSYGGGEFATEPAFEDDFLPGWEKNQKAWDVATWRQNQTQMSPERCVTDGNGILIQTVLAGDPALGGSMQTKA